ncbi:MAG: RagB/SusD family nutrient uptake outer membrane protein [Bacteroidaceae bacterium]|nr:RagB/SusD family nutrient uptake outer membrane protein [Bacteroidaceae bacterium]
MKQLYQTIRNGAALGLLSLALLGCSDFLQITPRDIVTEDNFWNEKADIDQMVAGCYASMQSDNFIRRCIVWGELRSENIYPGSKVQDQEDLYQALRENLLTTNEYCKWNAFYDVINKCNTVIRYAPEVSQKDPSYRSSDVQATIAEMTALRSLCYFYLIRAFDEVPFTRDAVTQEDQVQYLPASSFDYVLGEIIKDLESVKGNALEHHASIGQQLDGVGRNYNSNCNRITRPAINAMLAEMYLWQRNFDRAIECAEAVIQAKRDDYERDFSRQTTLSLSAPQLLTAPHGLIVPMYQCTQANPAVVADAIFGTGNSFESIFELSFNRTSSQTSYVSSSALSALYGNNLPEKEGGNNGAGFLAVNSAIVSDVFNGTYDYFANNYDTRYYTSFQPVDENYGEGNIRKGVAHSFNLQQQVKNNIQFNSSSQNAFSIQTDLNRNWIFYRLTDVMLLEAEALLMKATDDESEENTALLEKAFDLIYLVNARSVTDRTRYMSPTSAEATTRGLLIQRLRKERNAELMFEGKRFFDLVRYARFDGKTDVVRNTVTSKLSSGGSDLFPSMPYLFWPYAKEECQVNPYLVQKSIYGEGRSTYDINE